MDTNTIYMSAAHQARAINGYTVAYADSVAKETFDGYTVETFAFVAEVQ